MHFNRYLEVNAYLLISQINIHSLSLFLSFYAQHLLWPSSVLIDAEFSFQSHPLMNAGF